MKKIFFIGVFVLLSFLMLAQNPIYLNQYSINKFDLSPAYAGFNNNIEGFINYRNELAGFDGGPTKKNINIHAATIHNLGIGAQVYTEEIGILNNTSFSAHVAYHLTLNEESTINFGLSTEFFENKTTIPEYVQGSQFDPDIAYNQSFSGNMLNFGMGMFYQWKELNVGFSFPRLLEKEIEEESNTSSSNKLAYPVKRYLNFHASYAYEIYQGFMLEPSICYKKLTDISGLFHTTILVKYNDFVWGGITTGFGSGNRVGLTLGATFLNNLAVNYAYEFSRFSDVKTNASIHELTIGFLIGKNKEKKYKNSIFQSIPEPPYYEWIN